MPKWFATFWNVCFCKVITQTFCYNISAMTFLISMPTAQHTMILRVFIVTFAVNETIYKLVNEMEKLMHASTVIGWIVILSLADLWSDISVFAQLVPWREAQLTKGYCLVTSFSKCSVEQASLCLTSSIHLLLIFLDCKCYLFMRLAPFFMYCCLWSPTFVYRRALSSFHDFLAMSPALILRFTLAWSRSHYPLR